MSGFNRETTSSKKITMLSLVSGTYGKTGRDRGPEYVLEHKVALGGRMREAAILWFLVGGRSGLLLLLNKSPSWLTNQGWNQKISTANETPVFWGKYPNFLMYFLNRFPTSSPNFF